MSHAVRGPLVVDTGVFGAQLTPRTWPLGELYRPLVEGRLSSPLSRWRNSASVPSSLRGGHEGCDDLSAS